MPCRLQCRQPPWFLGCSLLGSWALLTIFCALVALDPNCGSFDSALACKVLNQ